MNFERLFLTKTNEFYRFNLGFEGMAYLLLTDTFSEAPKEYFEAIMDDDPDPSENFIFVQIGVTKESTKQEREELLAFTDGLLSFKPNIDYFIDFFDIDKEIEFNYPYDLGFIELVTKVNKVFKTKIKIENTKSFKNLVQE